MVAKRAAEELRSKAQQIRALRSQVRMIGGNGSDNKWDAIGIILDILLSFDHRILELKSRISKLEGEDNAEQGKG